MDLNELWKSALAELELDLPRPGFTMWLKESQLLKIDDCTATVGLPTNFIKTFVEKEYHPLILTTIRNLSNDVRRVEYIINNKRALTEKQVFKTRDNPKQQSFVEFKIDAETDLNPVYTLKSFAVGSSNEMAYSAINAVIDNVGSKYNPLFIYGGVGVGKTHLIQAAGNQIKEKYNGAVKVRYTTSEKFLNQVVNAIKNHRTETLKEKYRGVDVLIIDDIQFIAGKKATEEEFFHTFNALYQQNKQIIISSDRPPSYMKELEDRLRSRFEAGMTIDMAYPDFELKVAVLKNKLEEKGIVLSDEIINLVANKVQKSLRELEGILNKIIFYKETKKTEITPALLNQITGDITSKQINIARPDQIIRVVASHYNMGIDDITGKSRKQEFIEPRQVVAYLLKDKLDMSYPDIAKKIGKKDHTTAIYAYKKIKALTQKNHALNQRILVITDLIEKA